MAAEGHRSADQNEEGVDDEEPGWWSILETSRRVENRGWRCTVDSESFLDRWTEVAGECASGRSTAWPCKAGYRAESVRKFL